MKLKKCLALALALILTASLAACGSKEGAVFVQSVERLSQVGGIAGVEKTCGEGPGLLSSQSALRLTAPLAQGSLWYVVLTPAFRQRRQLRLQILKEPRDMQPVGQRVVWCSPCTSWRRRRP